MSQNSHQVLELHEQSSLLTCNMRSSVKVALFIIGRKLCHSYMAGVSYHTCMQVINHTETIINH